jgi:SAM-dependent methyltransferase
VHRYGPDFYRFLATFAVRSAERIVPKLADALPIRSVVDFGCGQGAWLSIWAKAGASVLGVDGPYVDQSRLLIDPANFHPADLAEPIELGRKFDLVQSLEVAEHLSAGHAERFVDTLTSHGSRVLFSAAVPGQGGENHINEQPLGYWRAFFRERGYVAIDWLRPLIVSDSSIARWYRCNIMLYVRDGVVMSLPEPLQRCRVPDDKDLNDYWPPLERLRHAVIRSLPPVAVNGLSRIKAGLAARKAGL